MSQEAIFDEIRDVFKKPMRNNSNFKFIILQPTGGGSKSLTIPALSESFVWTAASLAGKNAKCPIYLLADEELKDDTPRPKVKPDDSPIYISADPSPPAPNNYYSSFVDLVDEESDNSQLPSPVQPQFSPLTPTESQGPSLEVLLRSHQSNVIKYDQFHRITVHRSHIFSDALTAMRKGFDKSSNLRITFIGEPAVDAGGPLREFFRLVMKDAVSNNSLFQGPEDSRSPAHNVIELKKSTYKFLGEIFALSIVHGGPGPQCLSHPVANYLTYGIHKINGTIEDILDYATREKTRKLAKASDSEFRELIKTDEYDFIYDCGINVSTVTREEIIDRIISHYTIMVIKAELDEIKAGLDTLGILALLQNYPVKMRALFIAYQYQLTCDIMQDIFRISFSIKGSNDREKEEEVALFWVNLLQDVQNGIGLVKTEETEFSISLGDILAFATGASTVPPIGFCPQPSILFHKRSKYPEANTCSNILRLSLLSESYEEFKELFCFSIANAIGFGKV
ncbi:PREDICTED: G2/M phase-specific E3 ubiquitin-protein ligase-like [Amphimedon queenslandica]|nr:PREDICTED: G2/M phase-specific E3 ubiquitin-protein ligase-like [Amphimedon queenslandica]|eukprot:XP_019862007.1 PREDICTED: G2/M phase-specific E3 ubiquitin-protein ligase-like [Amphimedon queenslandica]